MIPTNSFRLIIALTSTLWLCVTAPFAWGQPSSRPTPQKATSHPASKALSARMQRWLPPSSPMLLSLHPKRVAEIEQQLPKGLSQRLAFFGAAASTRLKACRLMYLSLRFLLRTSGSPDAFAKGCARSLHPDAQVYLSPFASDALDDKSIWYFGGINLATQLATQKRLGTPSMTWLVPTKQPAAMQQAWATFLRTQSYQNWTPKMPGLPQKTVALRSKKGDYQRKQIALLIPRRGFLHVIISWARHVEKVDENRWSHQRLAQLTRSLKRLRQAKARKTQAWQHFLTASSALGLYIHGDRTLRAGVHIGLLDAWISMESSTPQHRDLLFGRYAQMVSVAKMLFAPSLADAEDASIQLLSQGALTLQIVQSLTATGHKLYQAAGRSLQKIVAKGGPYLLDLSVQADLPGLLNAASNPLPWMNPKTHIDGHVPSLRHLAQQYKNCGIFCPLALTATGPWSYIKGGLLGSPNAQTGFLPSRLRLVAQSLPSSMAKSSLKQLKLALAGEWPARAAKGIASQIKRLQQKLARQGISLYHNVVPRGSARCVMVGINLNPTTIFDGCKRAASTQGQLYSTSVRAARSGRMFAMLLALLTGSPKWQRFLPALLTSKVSFAASGWRSGHAVVHQLRWCRNNKCGALSKPTLPTSKTTPLPPRMSLPPKGVDLCLLQARYSTHKLGEMLDSAARDRLKRTLHATWKKLQAPLACLRKSPKHRADVSQFEAIWKAAIAFATHHRVVKHSKTELILQKHSLRYTYPILDALYPEPKRRKKPLNLTLVLTPNGVTIATRGTVISRGCSLTPIALAGKKIPPSQRLTCPGKTLQTTCVTSCIKKILKHIPEAKKAYVYVTPQMQKNYPIAANKDGSLSPLGAMLWALKRHQATRRLKWNLLHRYHRTKPWSFKYKKPGKGKKK